MSRMRERVPYAQRRHAPPASQLISHCDPERAAARATQLAGIAHNAMSRELVFGLTLAACTTLAAALSVTVPAGASSTSSINLPFGRNQGYLFQERSCL